MSNRYTQKFPNVHMIGKLQMAVEIIEEAMADDEYNLLTESAQSAIERAHSVAFTACSWAMQEKGTNHNG